MSNMTVEVGGRKRLREWVFERSYDWNTSTELLMAHLDLVQLIKEQGKKFEDFGKIFSSIFEQVGEYVVLVNYKDGSRGIKTSIRKPSIRVEENFLVIICDNDTSMIKDHLVSSVDVKERKEEVGDLREQFNILEKEFKEL